MERNSLLSLSLYVMGRKELIYKSASCRDCYFERDVCLFLLGLAYVVHLSEVRIWKRNNAFSWRPFFACPLLLPFGEPECYIWKDAVRASPCCSQVGFSQPVAMADAVDGWPRVMARLCPSCRQLWVCCAGDCLCLSFNLPPSPNQCSGLQQGLQHGLPKFLRTCNAVRECYSCGICSNWINTNAWVPHYNPPAS